MLFARETGYDCSIRIFDCSIRVYKCIFNAAWHVLGGLAPLKYFKGAVAS